MRIVILLATVVSFYIATPAGAVAEPLPDEVLEQIRSSRLDTARAVPVDGLEIEMGPAMLELTSGYLFPATPVAGSTRELVFVGQGRLEINAPDKIERRQLRIFSGESPLDANVTSAVLIIGNESIVSQLVSRPTDPAPDEAARSQAEELYDVWVQGPERRGFGADAAIFKSAFGDSAFVEYFAVLLDSEDHGRFYYFLDPSQLEQVTVGQFVAVELDEKEEHRVEQTIRRLKKRGLSVQARLEDLGHWDTWMRSPLRDDADESSPGSPGFEPEHYILDATLDTDDKKIHGRATIDLKASVSGRRGIQFELHSDLKPSAVVDGDGKELAWFRSGKDLHVLLAEPAAAGATVRVQVEYAGVILERYEKGILLMRDTDSWYPRTGAFDRATYDVTLRWPKSVGLLGSGRVVESGVEQGLRFERRLLEVPVPAFTFEVGDYKIIREQVGHIQLTIGFSKSSLAEDTGSKQEVLETLKQALVFYEDRFGPYPLDYLTVATVPREFSQGYLSFLTLSHYLLALPSRTWVIKGGIDERSVERRETVAHELAHQWWGNKVGWYNYRDQWLSEALADFSAVLFMAEHSSQGSVYRARHSSGWKRSLSRGALDGRRIESLGPVVLGERLNSSHSRLAYQAIVYDKGSMVFSMLARLLGEEQLVQMLKHLATAVGNRAIDTEVFLASIEKMSGADLTPFSDRFIYGTGIPEIYYSYSFSENPEGGWFIKGQARPVGSATYNYTLKRTESGHWDVDRHHSGNKDVSDLALVVPFQIVVGGSGTEESRKQKKKTGYATARGFGGNLLLTGEGAEFAIPISVKPTQFWLDQRGEVLAYFYSERRVPKRSLRYEAMELTGEEKESTLREALSADLMSEQVQQELGWSDKKVQQRTEVENARIHLELARLYLNDDREGAAIESFEVSEKMLRGPYSNWYRSLRDSLECRLAIRNGNYKRAFNLLKGELWLDVPRDINAGVGNEIVRRRWSGGRTGDGEDYALLAVSAHELGNELIARLAVEQAEQRGADMTPLTSLLE